MDGRSWSDTLRRAIFQRSFERRSCEHIAAIRHTTPEPGPCRACLAERTRAVHLRMCLTCGEVGCCDSSPARHARRHHEQTGHPLIRSVERDEHWVWCYVDRAYLSRVPTTTESQPRAP
jgi:uncharacterized UBP type Zn finger protein